MGFKKLDINKKISEELKKDKEFCEIWNETEIERELIAKIRMARKNEKITQGELAEKTGLSQQQISRMERKYNVPNLKTLLKLVNAMGYEIELRKTEEKKSEKAVAY